MKKEKGITLVSLVITIIILLILAGITLMALTGENGLFARAKDAKEKTQKEAATEKINLVIADIYTKSYAEKQENPTLQDLADGLCEDEETEYVDIVTRKTSALDKIEVGTNEAIYVKLKNYPYEYKINGELKIAEIDGIKVSDSTGSTGEGGNTGGTGGDTISGITKEELDAYIDAKLKSSVQSQFDQLESELKGDISELEGNIQQRLITSEVLFTGNASSPGDYTIKDISGYKYLMIYFDAKDPSNSNNKVITNSMLIDVKDITFSNSFNSARVYTTNYGAGDAFCSIYFFFKSSTKLCYINAETEWWTNPKIYRIDGIY